MIVSFTKTGKKPDESQTFNAKSVLIKVHLSLKKKIKSLRKKKFKNVLEKGQMIVKSIFSFSHNTFFFFQRQFQRFYKSFISSLKVPIAANKKEFVYKIKVNPTHTILKYGDYHDFMDR